MTPAALPEYSEASLKDYGVSELVQLLIRNEDRVPRNVIDECARRGSEMIEQLADLLQKDYYWGDDQTAGEWWLLLHAVMILGLIPEARAGELLVAYMRRMDEAGDETPEEWLSGYWPVLFHNKPASILPALRVLGEDRAKQWYVRVAAIEAAVASAHMNGTWPLDAALEWAAGMVFRDDEDFDVRVLVGNILLDFARPEYRDRLEALADLQPHVGRCFDRNTIEQLYAEGKEQPDWQRFPDPWGFYTPDAIEERQRRWAEEQAREDEADGESIYDEVLEPYVRELPKIGRNDPCPCGSGRKYKKCCLK